MPPKSKITKSMIVDACFDLIKNEGEKKVTARNVAEYLNCSTQPILYYFKTIDDIKRETYQKVQAFHHEYVTQYIHQDDDELMEICLNYIRFAREESHLFCFLFQSNLYNQEKNNERMIELISDHLQLSIENAREIYMQMFVFVHGYASLYANKQIDFDEADVTKALLKMFFGTLYTIREK